MTATKTSEKVFCLWNDGPVVEAWTVYLAKSRVNVYCRRPVTEQEVIDHATELYADCYGRVMGATKLASPPAYCATAPATGCPE